MDKRYVYHIHLTLTLPMYIFGLIFESRYISSMTRQTRDPALFSTLQHHVLYSWTLFPILAVGFFRRHIVAEEAFSPPPRANRGVNFKVVGGLHGECLQRFGVAAELAPVQ